MKEISFLDEKIKCVFQSHVKNLEKEMRAELIKKMAIPSSLLRPPLHIGFDPANPQGDKTVMVIMKSPRNSMSHIPVINHFLKDEK